MQEIQEQDDAVSASQRYVSIATDRYKLGLDPYLNVMTAQASLLGNQQSAINLRMQQRTTACNSSRHWVAAGTAHSCPARMILARVGPSTQSPLRPGIEGCPGPRPPIQYCWAAGTGFTGASRFSYHRCMTRRFLGSQSLKGRGALSNPPIRFESTAVEKTDDGWQPEDEVATSLPEIVLPDRAKSVITTNTSPDVGFEQSINPYRGCSHGCVYCFARPTHAYLGLSPGLDFETRLFYKENAAQLLRAKAGKAAVGASPSRLASIPTVGNRARTAHDGESQPPRGAGRVPSSGHHRNQEHPDPARPGSSAGSGQGSSEFSVMVSITSLDAAIKRFYFGTRAAAPRAGLKVIEQLISRGGAGRGARGARHSRAHGS